MKLLDITLLGWNIKIKKNKQNNEPNKIMKANRANLCSKDCKTAEKYLNNLIEYTRCDNQSPGIKESLIVAAIISYGRAFNTSRGDENIASNVNYNIGIATDNNKELISLHKTVIKKRNQVVAHSDSEFHKSEIAEVRETGVTSGTNIINYFDGIDIHLFLKLSHTMSVYFQSIKMDLAINSKKNT